jgi:hypothetical protein
MHLNTTVTYKDKKYSIYWTSEAAQHILENFEHPTHAITHTEISQLLRQARFKVPLEQETGRKDYYVFLTARAGRIWETYVYLVEAADGWPARCVVRSSYKSNKEQYRELFAF